MLASLVKFQGNGPQAEDQNPPPKYELPLSHNNNWL